MAGNHAIRWYVVLDDGTWLRRQSSMRGTWDYEARCACGWQTHTGGALERYVRELISDHKREAHQ